MGKRQTGIRNKISESHWATERDELGNLLPYLEKPPEGTQILRCKACEAKFASEQARASFCGICQLAINQMRIESADILRPVVKTSREEQIEAIRRVIDEVLSCPSCAWEGNQQRAARWTVDEFAERLDRWTETAQVHRARHLKGLVQELLGESSSKDN